MYPWISVSQGAYDLYRKNIRTRYIQGRDLLYSARRNCTHFQGFEANVGYGWININNFRKIKSHNFGKSKHMDILGLSVTDADELLLSVN